MEEALLKISEQLEQLIQATEKLATAQTYLCQFAARFEPDAPNE